MAGVRRTAFFALLVALLLPMLPARAAAAIDPGGWGAAHPFDGYGGWIRGAAVPGGAFVVGHGTAKAWVYREDTGRWAQTRSAPEALRYPLATTLADGRGLVLSQDKAVLVFDAARATWSSLGAPPAKTQFAALLGLRDGRVLATANGECAVYDVALTHRVVVGSAPFASCHPVGQRPDGRAILAFHYQDASKFAIGVFDPASMQTTVVPSSPAGPLTVLSTGEVLRVAVEEHHEQRGNATYTWQVRRASLFFTSTMRWVDVDAPDRDPGLLLPLANGGAINTGGEHYPCRTLDTLECSNPYAERESEPVLSAQTFDHATRTWQWAEPSPAPTRIGIELGSGRAAFVGEKDFVFAPPGLPDREAPRSTTKVGTLKDRSPLSVSGVSRDGFSGVRQVRVTYTPRVAAASKPIVRASVTLHCTSGRHRCDWSAVSPRVQPGTYDVSVSAIDRAGNVERSTARRTVVVV